MPRPIPAVVAPAVDIDRLSSELHRLHVEHDDAERAADAFDKKAAGSRERAREKALAMGRILIELRKAFPRSGPKAGGWGKLLADQGIEERTAQRWMAAAGYVEREIPDTKPNVSGTSLQRSKPAPRVTREAVDEDPPEDEGDDFDGDDGRTYSEPAQQHVTIHAQNVQIAAGAPGSVVVQQSALPVTPGARMVAVAGPRLRRIHQLLHEAAREWDAVLDELRPLVESGQIPRHAVDPLLRLPDAAKMREQAGQILGAAPAGECQWCSGRDPKCDGCKGRFWLDKDRLALASGDAAAAAQRSAS